jgi:site-specific DNA-methyltransferase (adenine-specific)
MIYEKAQACFGSNLSYLQCFEYMFVFSKGRPGSVNLIYDRPNVRGGKVESTVKTGPSADGFNRARHMKASTKLGRRKNIWKYGVGGGDTDHPAIFPLSLAADHIASWSQRGSIVLDPFAGSGTTAIAAERAGRRWICIERDEEYAAKAMARIRDHVSGGDATPVKRKATTVDRLPKPTHDIQQTSLF